MDSKWKNTGWTVTHTERRAGPFILNIERTDEHAYYWEISYEPEEESSPNILISGDAVTLETAKGEAEKWIRDVAQTMWSPRST